MVEQKGKRFEEYTVKELREVVNSKVPELIAEPKVQRMWYDDGEKVVTEKKGTDEFEDVPTLLWEEEETSKIC